MEATMLHAPSITSPIERHASTRTAAPSSSSPFARAPFRWTRRSETTLPTHVEGELPSWLCGDLVRTAPAVFELGEWRAEHLFDGLGLVYGFSFAADGVRFKQRALACQFAQDVTRERPRLTSFATPTRRTLLQRLLRPIPSITDNANVNIVPWQGGWLAMTEAPNQHVIDGDTLASRGLYRHDDELPKKLGMSAHPHFDFERRALVNVGFTYGPKNELWVFRQHEQSHRRELEGKLALERPPYVHAFGLTPRHVVLIDHPYRLNPLRLLFTNRPFIEPFAWQPERGTRLLRLDRQSGRWTEYQTDPLFCFHTVNTYEDGEDTVLDLLAHDDPSVVRALGREALGRGLPSLAPRFVRARMRPGKRHVELEALTPQGFEFPIIPYRARNGRAYQAVWGARLHAQGSGGPASEVVRVDVERGQTARFAESGMSYGEPVFVPRPGAERDDGVLLSVGSHAHEDRAVLAVLRADTLEPLAHVHVGLSIPLGFHGTFAARRT
jgi:carotenoid cleavage dioxygenase-like enzyme